MTTEAPVEDDAAVRVMVVIAAAALLAISALAAGLAGARGLQDDASVPVVACEFVSTEHALRVNYGSREVEGETPMVFLDRSGIAIRVKDEPSGPNVRCAGGRPTVRNTDRIKLATVTETDGSETYVDFSSGLFAPGATPEPGGDEIEIDASLGPNALVILYGASGNDDWVLGSRRKERYFANFNPTEGKPDRDLDMGFAPEVFGANLGLGHDRVTAKGGAGTGGPVSVGIFLIGSAGNDRLVGGPRDDELIGAGGDDFLAGGSGDDKLDLVGIKGRDTLICGPGRDRFGSTNRDKVRC